MTRWGGRPPSRRCPPLSFFVSRRAPRPVWGAATSACRSVVFVRRAEKAEDGLPLLCSCCLRRPPPPSTALSSLWPFALLFFFLPCFWCFFCCVTCFVMGEIFTPLFLLFFRLARLCVSRCVAGALALVYPAPSVKLNQSGTAPALFYAYKKPPASCVSPPSTPLSFFFFCFFLLISPPPLLEESAPARPCCSLYAPSFVPPLVLPPLRRRPPPRMTHYHIIIVLCGP